MRRASLLFRGDNAHHHRLHDGVVDDVLKCRIGRGLADIFVPFIEGFAQIFGAVGSVFLLARTLWPW